MSDKPPILFLHGAFAGPEVWTRFVAPWFAARGHQVAVPRLSAPLAARRAAARLRARGRAAARRRARGAAGGGRAFARRARRPAPRGAAAGGRAGAGRLAGALRARRRRSGSSRRGRRTCWRRSLAAQAGAGALLGLEAVRRALFTEETPLDWVAEVAASGLGRESPLALLDGLTWDLPAGSSCAARRCSRCSATSDAFVPITDLWAIAIAYGAETELVRGAAPRAADRPALAEPGLADQRLAGRAADRPPTGSPRGSAADRHEPGHRPPPLKSRVSEFTRRANGRSPGHARTGA